MRHGIGVGWKLVSVAVMILGLGCALLSIETVRETGRRRPALRYTEAEMEVLGAGAYEAATKEYELIRGSADAKRIERVGQRIANATGKDYDWEFRLLDANDVVNAFCLPGGKIAVYTGMLPVARNDDGLAVVLSHEIAHATLQHTNERLSQPLLKKLVGLPASIAVGVWGAISPGTRKLVMSGLGLGYVVGELLPYSQAHETEADDIGLIYMQKAGYDLSEGPRLWRRMAAEAGERITDSISTHPDPRERAARMERRIREMKRTP